MTKTIVTKDLKPESLEKTVVTTPMRSTAKTEPKAKVAPKVGIKTKTAKPAMSAKKVEE